ncbi:MAG: hypothetical protein ACFFC7_22550 [Candidatus Hermodarchaeota archaeon]
MSLRIDDSWKIAIKEAFIVIACTVGAFFISIVLLGGIGLIILLLNSDLFSISYLVYLMPLIVLFGFLTGLFKAIIDIAAKIKK